MSISSDLIQEFVKITNDSNEPTNTEETVYGTVVESDGTKYVRLDGSDQLTPVTTTIDISDGERVTVLIKNHTATITGNITSPAAKQVVVQNVNDKLDIAYGRIGDLSADTLNITQQLNAASADIEKLEADVANIGSVTVEYLEANYTKTYDLQATYATVESLNAVNAKIDNLDVGDLTADFVKTDVFEAAVARIDVLETNQLTIGQLDAKYATIVNLDAAVGRIRTLESTQITTDYLVANYASIDALNASELKVTNYIDTVEINGNRITAGTLTVDRLIVRGSTESIVYELNNITGALQAKSVDTLNGEIITPRTINADKVIAGSITTTELNVDKIFGNEAVINKIVAQDAFINAISTNSIVVGASNVANAAANAAATAQSTANTASTTATNAANAATAITSHIYVTGTTKIDGGIIETDTILADSINMNSLVGDSAFINAISTNSIVVGAQTAANTASAAATAAAANAATARTTAEGIKSTIYVSGTTEIDGGKIRTGTIDAACIKADSVFAQALTAKNLTIEGNSVFKGELESAWGTFGFLECINGSVCVDSDSDEDTSWNTGTGVGVYVQGYYSGVAAVEAGYFAIYGYNQVERNMRLSYSAISWMSTDATASFGLDGAVLSNNVAYYVQNTNEDDVEAIRMGTNNYLYLGAGKSSRLHVGSSSNTSRLQMFSAGRMDLLTYGATTDTTTDGVIGISISNSGMTGAKTTLRPCQAGKASLGDATYYWKNLHCQSIYHSGTINLFPSGSTTSCLIASYESSSGNCFYPNSNGNGTLGSTAYKWKAVYATTGSIQTSDRRYKSDIRDLDDRYEAMAQLLTAKSYIMDIVDEKRRVGYIAQDLEEIALSVGLSMDECSFISKDWIEREDYTGYEYSLDYTQIHTLQIASLQKKVNDLQNRLAIAEAQLQHYQVQQLGS